MGVIIRNAGLLLALAASLTSCGFTDPREVYHGEKGEPLAAIVAAIGAAERSVLARSPALPRQAVLDALAAARRRGVLVEFVVCEQEEMPVPDHATPVHDEVPIRFDRSHHPKSGAVLVIDSRTVVRTSYPWDNGKEAVMIIRDSPELGERIAADFRNHVARAETRNAPESR